MKYTLPKTTANLPFLCDTTYDFFQSHAKLLLKHFLDSSQNIPTISKFVPQDWLFLEWVTFNISTLWLHMDPRVLGQNCNFLKKVYFLFYFLETSEPCENIDITNVVCSEAESDLKIASKELPQELGQYGEWNLLSFILSWEEWIPICQILI